MSIIIIIIPQTSWLSENEKENSLQRNVIKFLDVFVLTSRKNGFLLRNLSSGNLKI